MHLLWKGSFGIKIFMAVREETMGRNTCTFYLTRVMVCVIKQLMSCSFLYQL